MQFVSLNARKRDVKGSSSARRIRRTGEIPAVVYGAGGEHLLLVISKQAFSKILHTKAGEHAMVELRIDGGNGEEKLLTIIKEVQHDPITDYVIHVDFEQIRPDVPVEFNLPIEFVGTPAGVKNGGVFTPLLRELTILCTPLDAPDSITVDVSGVEIGHSVHVKDISIPNAKILHSPEMPIATVILPKAVEEAKPREEAAPEGEEKKPEETAAGGEQPAKEKEKEKEKKG